MKSTLNITILIAGLLLAFSSSSFSQAGTLDSSFGVNGKVTTYFNVSDIAIPFATALQQDGKIVVAVGVGYLPSGDFVLMRYQTKGNLDSSFGINGQVTTHFDGHSFSSATALTIQSDGKIIAAGYTSDYYYALARFLPNGNLDSAFGTNGKVLTKPINEFAQLYTVAVQNNGKILVGGEIGWSDNSCLIQYTSNGIVDSTFGINGQIKYLLGSRVDDIAIQKDGKIVVASKHWNDQFYVDEFGTYRLLPNGSLDSSFGINGHVYTDFGNEFGGDAYPMSLVILKDSNIIVGGFRNGGWAVLAKYTANGLPDSSFGINGKVTLNGDGAQKVMAQNDGKLIVALGHSFSYDSSFVIIRCNSNGSIDSTFDFDGIGTAGFGGQASLCSGILQQDEKIVVAGFFGYNSPNVSLARFNGDPTTISILKNISTFEGNSSTTPVTFKVILNKPSTQTIKVNYTTQDGKAKAVSDYVATSGTLTFRPGQASKKVVINVIGDNVVESNERFSLQLSNPQNAILGTLSTATCTIKNDDAGFAGASSEENNSSSNNTSITLYPNPVKDVLKLEGLNADNKTTISIADVQGKIILKATTLNAFTSLNVKQLPAGTYLVKIETNNTTTTLKFIKE